MFLIHLCHVRARGLLGLAILRKESNQLMEYLIALLSRLQIYSLLNIPRLKCRMVISENDCFGKHAIYILKSIAQDFNLK